MNKTFLTFTVFFIALGSLSAQSFIGKINPFPNQKINIMANDTLKILAVIVNFQEDKDGTTFGNGKLGSIYSGNYGNNILDPLPHNKDYFESHLTFVKNYYQKVSNNKVNISFTVLPDTFSVSKTMRNYTPASNSNDFTPLAEFAQEVWTKADEMNPGFNFSDYDVFLIFHAGVGRDISLPGSLGNEKDLPSVYLNDNTLKNIYGSTFEGFPVSNNSYKITNSMIIPETESRELESISGNVLYEITINGLLVASVASYLGLPDLFDTETGLSAIGRFGLMDGQSIFAFNGVFPPEPSAWEKIYLGWAEPVTIEPGNYDVNIVTKLAASLTDTVILKVPLSSTEYYLIENRQRDVFNDGAKLTVKSNGYIFSETFPNDTTGFYSYDVDSLAGVILDVDEYDWALPGNGIVIWHIDQNVIDEKLTDNKINTDKTKRGVDVEEADGVQDIGETYTTILGDVVIGEGTEQDFWYSGNKARLFKNRFDKNSRPDTKTNSGANSLISINNFSSISNKMSFNIEYGDSVIKPLFNFDITPNSSISSLTDIADGDTNMFGIISSGNLVIADGYGVVSSVNDYSDFKPASVTYNNETYVIGVKVDLTVDNTKINCLNINDGSFNSSNVTVGYVITTKPVIRKNVSGDLELLLGTRDGKILIYDLLSVIQESPILKNELNINPDISLTSISCNESNITAIGMSKTEPSGYYYHNSLLKFDGVGLTALRSTLNDQEDFISIVSTSENEYVVISNDEIINKIKAGSFASLSDYSFGDIKNDGNNYLLVADENKLSAYNLAGSLADNFPKSITEDDSFVNVPLVADIEGDSRSEVIAVAKNGNVYAYDGGTGKIIDGFPISFGAELKAGPILFKTNESVGIAGIDQLNKFKAWTISSIISQINWSDIDGNNQNSSFVDKAKNTDYINQFLPTTRAYNYPNPVYSGQTAIRYYVDEDSKVSIKIFDLAGSFVAELNDDANGGLDNETIWNVGDIQSGVYLARIEAVGLSSKSESVVIKIAVVK